MSAQLTLTDLEMHVLKKCIGEMQAVAQSDKEAWLPGEPEAALSAYQKLSRGLNRPSRRRSKSR